MGRSLEDCEQREDVVRLVCLLKDFMEATYVISLNVCICIHIGKSLIREFLPVFKWDPLGSLDEAFQLLLRIMFLNTLNKMHTKDHKGNHLY